MGTAQRPQMEAPIFTPEQIEAFNAQLAAKNATQPCPRCGGNHGLRLLGFGVILLGTDPASIDAAQPGASVLTMACNNCGFISQHLTGTLGV